MEPPEGKKEKTIGISEPQKEVINFYSASQKYGPFSNFSRHPVKMNGVVWPTSEHYFQAQKFAGTRFEEEIRKLPSPRHAKDAGGDRKKPLRSDWTKVKNQIMEDVVAAKFTQHPDLNQMLLSTGNAILVEHTQNDSYWGDGGDGSGQNMLGKTLMAVRDKLLQSQNTVHSQPSQDDNPLPKKFKKNTVKPDLGKLKPQKFQYFCVLDFEATCEENKRITPQEIIEFPTVLVNATTTEIEDEFQTYVRPTAHPKLTNFCTELTGIQQEWVDKGILITEALKNYQNWIQDKGLFQQPNSFAFVTCGDWDLKTCLPKQAQMQKFGKQPYFDKWINIKKVFSDFYKLQKLRDMVGMLDWLHIPLEGRHHSGIDDCRNIAKILQMLLRDGCILDFTSQDSYHSNSYH